MKILLVGEYNRAHYNVKKGLEALGHEAIVVSTTDGFKKVTVDVEIKDNYSSFFLKKLRVLLYNFFKIDLLGISIKKQIKSKKDILSNYDIVQFINESPFHIDTKSSLDIFNWLCHWNGKSFLLSCGLDYPSVKYAFDKKFRYSVLTAYFEKKGSRKDFSAILSYLRPEHVKLHHHIYNTIEGVIANDIDYHLPLLDHPKYLGMIPHAIDLSELEFNPPEIEDKIVIFHGINTFNYYKKGNDIFEKALAILSEKNADKIEIITVKNLPYKEYILAFDKCHILLDQVYAYDQGYNALEAMSKGKVVLTGAEQEWLNYFNVKENEIAINALPDAKLIAEQLEWLVKNPAEIIKISKNARAFVETHHNYINCAKAYLNLWQSSLSS